MHKIQIYLWYSSPYYSRKARCWIETFKAFGYSWQSKGDKKGVLLYSDEPLDEEIPEMYRFIYSRF